MTTCPICQNTFSQISALKIHLTIVHMYAKGTLLVCRESKNCSRVFNDFKSFRKHLTSAHKSQQLSKNGNLVNENSIENNFQCILPDNVPHNEEGEEQVTSNSEGIGEKDCIPPTDPVDDNESIDSLFNELSFKFLKFVCKQYANHKLPTDHVQSIVDDVTNLVDSITTKMKRLLIFNFNNKEININDVSTAVNRTNTAVLNIFKPFRTHHRRLQIFRDSDYLIPMEQRIVGDRVDYKRRKGTIVKDIVPVYASYISISAILQKVFSLPGVYSAVKHYMEKLENEKTLLQNFIQGKLWKRKVAKFFRGKFVIPLFLYFDDFEVNNALGSHAGYKKMGVVYFTIATLPPKVKSLLDSIFMAAIFHSSDRVEFSNFNVFHRIIDELNFLQTEGILVDTDEGEVRLFFSLGLIIGDNLGLNSILGFAEGFNATNYCRLCVLSKNEIQYEHGEKRLRLDFLNNNDDIEEEGNVGIKESCVWNGVNNFRAESNFCVDWLHDGPEGWFKRVMLLIIKYFATQLKPKEKTFTSCFEFKNQQFRLLF